ncbi:MAG: hypothetical protein ACLR82_03180 [Bifidobacterium longum]|nr:hypothetical protein [Bifidobacterium longum]UOG11593.1 hypothetical protein MT990_04335 [Bifidobacterium longum subsp. infantis]
MAKEVIDIMMKEAIDMTSELTDILNELDNAADSHPTLSAVWGSAW